MPKNRNMDIHKFLPTNSKFYDELIFNYLSINTNDELSIGENIVINAHNNNNWHVADLVYKTTWDVYYKGDKILMFNAINYFGAKSSKYYNVSTFDNSIVFSTDEFQVFTDEDTEYMCENFFYEYMCFKLLIKNIKKYLKKEFNISQERNFNTDFNTSHLQPKTSKFIDKRLIEAYLYLEDDNIEKITKLKKL